MRILSAVALAFVAVAPGLADEADRQLLIHGHPCFAEIRDFLLSRVDHIRDDLAWAVAAPSWRTRMLAEVVALRAADAEAFAREKARSAEVRTIFLRQCGVTDASAAEAEVAQAWREDPLTLALRRRPTPPPAQQVPWPVLADALQDGAKTVVLLHFWAEPRLELLAPLWDFWLSDDENWVLEQGILGLGEPAVPFLAERLRESLASPQSAHPGLLPRVLTALRGRGFFAEYRQRLAVPSRDAADANSRERRFADEDTLVGMEILAAARDADALPLLVELFVAVLENGWDVATDGRSTHSMSRPAGDRFPESPPDADHPHVRFIIDRIAGAIASYGPEAVPVLRARCAGLRADLTAGQESPTRRIVEISDLLIGYLVASDDASQRLAILRWNTERSGDLGLLLDLRRLTGESIAPFVERRRWFAGTGTSSRWNSADTLDRLHLLAASGDLALVPIFSRWGAALRQEFASAATKLQQRRSADALDPQLLREQAGAMLSADGPTRALLAVDEALLAIIRLGGPDAAVALRAAAAEAPWTRLATAGLHVLEKRPENLVADLESPAVETAEAAAQALWVAGDARAQLVLLAGAARHRGESHQRWLQRARDLGSLDAVTGRLAATVRGDVRVATLCAAIEAQAAHPETVAAVLRAVEQAANAVSVMHVLRTSMIVSAGRGLVLNEDKAQRLGAESRPILEGECLFGVGAIRRGVAANALAALGDERSMAVIAASADMGAPGGSNPIVPALEAFGERGAALAAAVPELVPAQADTGLRVTAHRYGTQVLAELGDIRAVEQILDGLATLAADRHLEGWGQRVGVYLDAAAKCTDDRLVEPLLMFAREPEVSARALLQLGRYQDPRCEAALLAALRTGIPRQPDERTDQLHEGVANTLVARWGAQTCKRLVTLATGADPRMRAMAGLALADLSHPGRTYNTQASWPASLDDAAALARATREAALPILIAALADADPESHAMAAAAAVRFIGGRAERAEDILGARTILESRLVGDGRLVGPLADWLRRGGDPDWSIIECLGREGGEATGVVILDLLGKPRQWLIGHNPDQIVRAISSLNPPGAVASLERLAAEPAISEYDTTCASAVEGLAHLGPDGLAALGRLQRTVSTHRLRSTIAGLLSGAGVLDPRLTREHLEACLEQEDAPEFRATGVAGIWVGTCTGFLDALLRSDAEAGRLAMGPILRHGPDDLRSRALQVLTFARRAGAR